jgi:hypothetical protein
MRAAHAQVQPNGEQLQVIADYFKEAEIRLVVERIFKLAEVRCVGSCMGPSGCPGSDLPASAADFAARGPLRLHVRRMLPACRALGRQTPLRR